MSETKKILWAMSPTESEPQGDQHLKNLFEVLSKTFSVEIKPVYVLSADYYVTSEYFEPIDVQALKDNMKQECAAYLNQFPGKSFTDPVVLENSYSARGAEVRLFQDYVEQEKPDFVVLNSHGRSGWARTFLGSFVESFLLKTKTPTIVLGPKCAEIKSLKKAIMPVQLSESSQKFVEGFLDDHRLSFVEKLVLFHKISMVDIEAIAWAPTLYGLSDFNGVELMDRAKTSAHDYLKSFLDHPLSQKRLEYKVSEKVDAISDVILEEASSADFDLIVMNTEAGTFEANLLGSITRDVIREAQRPVIVYPHLFKS